MSRIPSMLAAILLLVAGPGHASAQTFRPIGEQYRDVSAVLQDIGAKSVVYLPVGKEDKQLFYIPFFAMKADKDGKLDVAVLNGPTATSKTIAVWMLLSPQNKLEGMATYIRAQEAISPIDRRFADTPASQLVGIPFANLDIIEEEPRIGFRPVRLVNYSAQGEVQLVAEVSADDAQMIASDLREKKRLPIFTVQYDLSARQTLSQSEFQADLRYFSETKGAKTLLGSPKTSEKFGWSGSQLHRPFVTRDQRGTFEGQMKAEIRTLIQLEDERDVMYLQYMQGYFDKVFQRLVLDTDKTPLGEALSNLNTYDFDPKDITPDRINKLVADVKDFFKQNNADENKFKAAISASFLGIGGSASGEYEGKTLRERMEDKGWKFDVEGGFSVPKSFEVHVVNEAALKTEGVLSLQVIRTARLFARFNHRVSASNVYYPRSAADHLVALEELRGQSKQLSDKIDDLTKRSDDFVTKGTFHELAAKSLEYKIESVGLGTGTPDRVPESQRWRWFVTTKGDERPVGMYPGKKIVAVWVTSPHHHHEQHRYVDLIPEIRKDNEVWLKATAATDGATLMTINIHVLYHDAVDGP